MPTIQLFGQDVKACSKIVPDRNRQGDMMIKSKDFIWDMKTDVKMMKLRKSLQ